MIAVPPGLTNFDLCHPLDPAGGTDFDYTAYAGWSHFIVAVEYKLQCDGTVVNRHLGLIIEVQGAPAHDYYLRYSAAIPANTPHTVSWTIGITTTDTQAIVGNRENLTMVCPLYLRPADHIRSHVVNLQAGDQITDIYIYQYVFHV